MLGERPVAKTGLYQYASDCEKEAHGRPAADHRTTANNLMTIQEVAQALRVSRATAYRLIDADAIFPRPITLPTSTSIKGQNAATRFEARAIFDRIDRAKRGARGG